LLRAQTLDFLLIFFVCLRELNIVEEQVYVASSRIPRGKKMHKDFVLQIKLCLQNYPAADVFSFYP
jgi:hypothetical protein